MSTRTVVVLCLLLAASGAGAQEVNCGGDGEPARQVEVCTKILDTVEIDTATRANVLHNRGHAYRKLGKPDEAIADYSKALDLVPNHKNSNGARGLAYMDKKDFKAALADLTQAMALDPESFSATYWRGAIHGELGDYASSLADLTRAISIKPDDPGARFMRGIVHETSGSKPEAIEDYRKTLALKSNHANARAALKRLGATETAPSTP